MVCSDKTVTKMLALAMTLGISIIQPLFKKFLDPDELLANALTSNSTGH